jgi:hypothetical protein
MSDLVTSQQVLAALPSLTPAQQTDLAATISAASRAIESYCDRSLARATFDQLYLPERSRCLWLKNYPVADISRVAAGAAAVLTVSATLPSAFNRATASLSFTGDPPYQSPTGLTLRSSTGGVAATTTLAFSGSPTLAQLATAIGAVTGWSATVAPGRGAFACVDLTPETGARDALTGGSGAAFWAFAVEVSDYDLEPARGLLTIGNGWPFAVPGPSGWYADTYRYPDRMWGVSPRFGQVRVVYDAGYSTIPDDVTRAAIMTVKAIFDSTPFSGTFSAEKVSAGNSTYSYSLLGTPGVIPPVARALLSNYRKVRT